MTNRDLAELRDPEHRMPGWWMKHIPYSCPHCNRPLHGTHITPPAEDLIGGYRCLSCRVMHTSEFSFTGPDWHASDDACFRDWRPVLLAAGCRIECILDRTNMPRTCVVFGLSILDAGPTYRTPVLAAVAWLAEHKPELLREAIARMEDRK